jgi:hypothetical protein
MRKFAHSGHPFEKPMNTAFAQSCILWTRTSRGVSGLIFPGSGRAFGFGLSKFPLYVNKLGLRQAKALLNK